MKLVCFVKVHVLPADIPLKKAVAGVRVGLLPEVGFMVNPTVQQMEESTLDLIMAGTDSAVLMIEGYCDFLTEAQMLEVCTQSCCYHKGGTAVRKGLMIERVASDGSSQKGVLTKKVALLFTCCFGSWQLYCGRIRCLCLTASAVGFYGSCHALCAPTTDFLGSCHALFACL